MPVTMADVRAALDPEEPNYDQASQLGPAALPFLAELTRGSDLMLATKATYLAGRIGGAGRIQILESAASHADPSMRVAAAGAVSSLPPDDASRVLPTLLTDRDSGVRKVAVKSAANKVSTPDGAPIRARLEVMSRVDPDPTVRALAQRIIAGP